MLEHEPQAEPESEREHEPTRRERMAEWLSRMEFVLYTTIVVLLLVLGFVWPRMFITIPPGHSGVMYRCFKGGTVTDQIWAEGLHIIPPWDTLTPYETRLQQKTLELDVLSEEGLNLSVEVAVRYRPHKNMLGYLHQDIGTDYFERLIEPEVEAHVRRTFGGRSTHELYSSARDVLQELGRIPVLGKLDDPRRGAPTARSYVDLQELKLVAIEMPKLVEQAIAEKYRQEQLMLEYRYRLEREEKEAERKRTEAAGIRDYNLIASKISPDLLRWRGLDATLELAKSQNAKVVVIGGGQNGLPLIMNLGDGPSSSGTSPTHDTAAPNAGGKTTAATAASPAPSKR